MVDREEAATSGEATLALAVGRQGAKRGLLGAREKKRLRLELEGAQALSSAVRTMKPRPV